MKKRTLRLLPCALLAMVAALTPWTSSANDAAASLGAGGLELRTERRVTMARERLYIGARKGQPRTDIGILGLLVRVEYEFVNDTTEDVSTEVAFPIAPLPFPNGSLWPTSRFESFRVWVDGREIAPKKSVRAFRDGRDVTAILGSAGVPVESYGGFDEEKGADVFHRLPRERSDLLVREKLVSDDLDWPLWDVAVTYHWLQKFPAGKTVKVRHEYHPSFGAELVHPSEVAVGRADGCFDGKSAASASQRKPRQEGQEEKIIPLMWVDYILTTANTWKTPIRDFELVVERPADTRVSFCWDGEVERVEKTQFRARVKDFVPKRELRVYFYKQ